MQRRDMPGLSLNLLTQSLEQGRLLATGNEYFRATPQMLGGRLQFMATQLIHRNHLLGSRGLPQRLRIKGLCFIAAA